MGVKERIDRAKSQKMYLINRAPASDQALEREFTVLGSVGNVYTVKISKNPSCNCPDFGNGNLCKHILFIYLKVLKVPFDSDLIYQTSLLTSEVRSIFLNAPKDPATVVLASKAVRDEFKKMTTKDSEKDDVIDLNRKSTDDDCPICYETLKKESSLLWCRTCGNNVHESCFKEWKATAVKDRKPVTCVLCRAIWPSEKEKKTTNKNIGEDGYVNLASLQPNMQRERPEWEPSYYRREWY